MIVPSMERATLNFRCYCKAMRLKPGDYFKCYLYLIWINQKIEEFKDSIHISYDKPMTSKQSYKFQKWMEEREQND